MRNLDDIRAAHAATARFVAHRLLPALLERIGRPELVDELTGCDLRDRTAVGRTTSGLEWALREHTRSGDGDVIVVLRTIRRARDFVTSWTRAAELTDAQLDNGRGEYRWEQARRDLREICRDTAALCDGPLQHHVRLLAANVRWDNIDAELWGLDDAAARRLCDLAEANACAYQTTGLVARGAERITDEACKLVCAMITPTGVWVDAALDVAATVPADEMRGIERIFSAIIGRDRWNVNRQQAFIDARDLATALDPSTVELTAQLVQSGLPVHDAATAARAATAA